jgi:triosephosphate isomerase (TIM)
MNMRKQIAAANWKMNLSLQQGEQLLDDFRSAGTLSANGTTKIKK